MFEPFICGSEKSRKIPTKLPTKIPCEMSKKNHRRASAGAQAEQVLRDMYRCWASKPATLKLQKTAQVKVVANHDEEPFNSYSIKMMGSNNFGDANTAQKTMAFGFGCVCVAVCNVAINVWRTKENRPGDLGACLTSRPMSWRTLSQRPISYAFRSHKALPLQHCKP